MMFLSSTELQAYVQSVAEKPVLWMHLVSHGEKRSYQQLISSDVLNCWVISWNTGHDTGFHDHDGSAGAVVVLEGNVIEERLKGTFGCIKAEAAEYSKNRGFHFGPYDIHRVHHVGKKPSVTIHAYSPPLNRMGSYGFNSFFEFQRLPTDGGAELRPLEAAVATQGSYANNV